VVKIGITPRTVFVLGMRDMKQFQKKIDENSCASCGKIFQKNEMKVSYDFEHFYCFSCDDKR